MYVKSFIIYNWHQNVDDRPSIHPPAIHHQSN